MSALRPPYTLPFSKWLVTYWASLIAQGQSAAGRNLENLVSYLFLTVTGLTVRNRKLGLGGEIDILVANFATPGDPLRWFGDYFLVECKDRGDRVSEKEFGHFLTKLNLTKTKQGAIVSREGFSGSRGFGYSKRDQKIAHSEMGVVVLDMQLDEVQTLGSVAEFLRLLQNKYEELRFH